MNLLPFFVTFDSIIIQPIPHFYNSYYSFVKLDITVTYDKTSQKSVNNID